MRFSTAHHPSPPSISNLKKVFSTLVSKLPHNQKVSPPTSLVKNDARTLIRVVAKQPTKTTEITKQNDIYRDMRNYYAQQQQQQQPYNRKRQLTIEGDCNNNNNNKVIEEKKRETRHKTVKQYQQKELEETTVTKHWIEERSVINNAQQQSQPKWLNTHSYVRATRFNSNYLRVMATTHKSQQQNTNKPFLRKRNDEFIWARKSNLRNELA